MHRMGEKTTECSTRGARRKDTRGLERPAPELRLDRLVVSRVALELGSPTCKSLEFRGSIPMGKAWAERRGIEHASKKLLPFCSSN